MEFIRNNLYYVVLAGIVVAGGGVIVAVGAGAGGTVTQQIGQRGQEDGKMASLLRNPQVTKGVIKAEEERVGKIKEQTTAVDAGSLQWNRGDYPMFQTRVKPGDTPYPAFQADPKIDAKFTLERWMEWKRQDAERQKEAYYEHNGAYLEELEKLLREQLRATSPPTPQGLWREREGRRRRLQAERDDKRKREEMKTRAEAEKAKREAAAAGASGPPAAVRPEDRKYVHTIVKEEPVETQAEREARDQLTLERSETGYIYANVEATYPVYREIEPLLRQGGRQKLWRAYVHSRVTRDIVMAIRETVVDVVTRDKKNPKDPEKATVADSPVKHLVQIRIQGMPYTGGTPVYGEMGRAGGALAVGKPGPAPSLTGRISDKQYDVIRYEFDVVMADRYVGDLKEKLYRQNDHFVLAVQAQKVTGVVGARGMGPIAGDMKGELGMAGGRADTSLCYYGVDPVMLVTIKGELLMRTDWCRDLMPEEVLTELKRALPSAIRSADEGRLQNAAKAGVISRTGP